MIHRHENLPNKSLKHRHFVAGQFLSRSFVVLLRKKFPQISNLKLPLSSALGRTPMMLSVLPSQAPLERIRRLCNLTVAGIWLYQGIVPKLLGPHPDEIAMSKALGILTDLQASVSYAAGVGEVLLGLCVLFFSHRAWPQLVSAVATAVLLGFVAIYTPRYLIGAFNPVVMNIASIALSMVALLAFRAEAPSAA